MAVFTQTQNGAVNDGGTYGNTSPGVSGTDFPGTGDDCITANTFTMTFPATYTMGSLDYVTGSKIEAHANGTALILDDRDAGGSALTGGGEVSGNFDITTSLAGLAYLVDTTASSGAIRNYTKIGSGTARIDANIYLSGDLNHKAGGFNPNGNNYSLECNGNMYVMDGTFGNVSWVGSVIIHGTAIIEIDIESGTTQEVYVHNGIHKGDDVTLTNGFLAAYDKIRPLATTLLEWNMIKR